MDLARPAQQGQSKSLTLGIVTEAPFPIRPPKRLFSWLVNLLMPVGAGMGKATFPAYSILYSALPLISSMSSLSSQ